MSTVQEVPPTVLVLRPDERQEITPLRSTDLSTALTKGLADYARDLETEAYGGRIIQFKNTYQTWAEPENLAVYPSAAVYSSDPGQYDSSRFTPKIDADQRFADGTYYMTPCEFVKTLTFEAWTTDPVERMALVAMLEDAFNPVEWMYGFRLRLPHYHGVHADYALRTGVYDDSETDAARRYRRAVFTLDARIPQIRIVGRIPIIKPGIRFSAQEDALPNDLQRVRSG